MNNKGFTLIELIITVAIIGILSMIAVPAYIGQQKNAQRTEAYSNLQNLRLLEEQYFAENGRYAPNPDATWTYKGTLALDNGIEDVLTGFKPGAEASLGFTYSLTSSGTGTAFTATATGKAGKRIAGEVYTIDNNNNRNF